MCETVGVPFPDSMLSWSQGNPTDDIWCQYKWYDTVRKLTEFQPYKPKEKVIPESFEKLLYQCEKVYR